MNTSRNGNGHPDFYSSNPAENFLSRFYTGGAFFRVPVDFFHILSIDEAIILAYLINHSERVKARKHKSGWFYCTSRAIENEINMGRYRQHRHISRLITRNLLKAERRGMPSLRWLKVNYTELNKQIKAMQEKQKKTEDLERHSEEMDRLENEDD
jgi:hypothetical protein